jgi:hypothetical protein
MMTHTARRPIRRLIGASAAAAAALVLIACGSQQSGDDPANTGHAAHEHSDHEHAEGEYAEHEDGSRANASVDDPLAGADLKQLTAKSDLVVRGTVTGARADVPLAKGDPTAKYTIYTLKVQDVARGAAGSQVELALLSQIEGANIVFEERQNPKVGDSVVALLRKIAPEFNQPGYVLTGQSGLLVVKPDGGVISGIEGSSPIAAEAKTLRTVDQVLSTIRSVPQK